MKALSGEWVARSKEPKAVELLVAPWAQGLVGAVARDSECETIRDRDECEYPPITQPSGTK